MILSPKALSSMSWNVYFRVSFFFMACSSFLFVEVPAGLLAEHVHVVLGADGAVLLQPAQSQQFDKKCLIFFYKCANFGFSPLTGSSKTASSVLAKNPMDCLHCPRPTSSCGTTTRSRVAGNRPLVRISSSSPMFTWKCIYKQF